MTESATNTPTRAVIERIRVKNYRSLADVDLTLGPLTVLVGRNGSGKSTVIDVLRFVRDAITRGLDAALLARGGIGAVRRWSAKGRPYDVTIQLNLRQDVVQSIATPRDERTWRAEYSFTIGSGSRGEYRVKAERLEVESDTTPRRVMEIRDGQWAAFLPDLEDALTRTIPLFKRPDIAETALNIPAYGDFTLMEVTDDQSSLAFPSLGSQVFRCLRDASFYTIYPDSLREPQKPANAYPLDERGQNLASVLRELKRNRAADFTTTFKDALSRVVEGVTDYSVRQVGGYLVTTLHHAISEAGRAGPAFELAQESDGTLRMLGILAALYQVPPRPLLTVEEPELTIHPGALGVLCDMLLEASTRSQVLITTHHPDLIDHFPAEALRVVENVEGITHVGPVSAHQREAVAARLFSSGELMRIEGLRSDVATPIAER